MRDFFESFFSKNFLLIALVSYGLFIILWQSDRGFLVDEAIYAQVARESLASAEWQTLRWQGELWFEKPPVGIWLNALAFRLWGVSEAAAHFFPRVFFILAVLSLYWLGKEMFKDRLAGFFAGFIFLTSPLVFYYAGTNMLDIPAGVFLIFSLIAIWKILEGLDGWYVPLGIFAGLAVMTKWVVGLFPLLIWLIGSAVFRVKPRAKLPMYFGAAAFLFVSLPWHILMSLRHGALFWKEYFSFHVWERFFTPVLLSPWENNSGLAYPQLFLERSGAWIWIWGLIALLFLWSVIFRRSTDFPSKGWIGENKKPLMFLFLWILAVFLPFLLAKTKLPNYMLLSYFPLALAGGGYLAYVFRNKIWSAALIIFLSFINFLPLARLNVQKYGEGRYFFELLGDNLNLGGFSWKPAIISGIILTGILFFFFRKNRTVIVFISGLLIAGLNLLFPDGNVRNGFMREVGRDVASIAHERPVRLYVVNRADQFYFHNMAPFYLPLGSKVKRVDRGEIEMESGDGQDAPEICFIENEYSGGLDISGNIKTYPAGALFHCRKE